MVVLTRKKMVKSCSTIGDMVMSCSIKESCTLQPHISASSQLGRTPGNGVVPVFLPHGLEGEIVGFLAHVFFVRCFVLEYGVPIRKVNPYWWWCTCNLVDYREWRRHYCLPLIGLDFLFGEEIWYPYGYIRRGSALGFVSQRQIPKCVPFSVRGWERAEKREIGREERVLVFLFFLVYPLLI